MQIKISFDQPILSEQQVSELTIDDVNVFYATASETERTNLFFMLLSSFHFYRETNDNKRAAHLSYTISYYVFTALTPPASEELALYYAEQTVALDDAQQYRQWAKVVAQGN